VASGNLSYKKMTNYAILKGFLLKSRPGEFIYAEVKVEVKLETGDCEVVF
jgi:hypothetical protein